jgi:hypothetical protein
VYRQLIDGSVYEWGSSQTSNPIASTTVTLLGGHSIAPTIIITSSGSNSNVSLASVTKDVFVVSSSDPGVMFTYYAVSKP